MERTAASLERFPHAVHAAWALLGVLFTAALLWHGVPVYPGILAAAAIVAVLLCLASERASVVFFVGCQALDAYGFITDVPFSISVARIVVVAVVAGAVLRTALARPREPLDLRHAITTWDIGILVFLAGATFSVPFSYSLPLSLVGIAHLAFLVGAYFVLSRAALRPKGRADITTTTIAVGALTAVVALGQTFVRGFFVEVVRPAAAVNDAAATVRASGFFDNPNTMALLLVLVVMFATERVWSERRPLLRAAYALAAALSLAAIGVSESRAALVGVVVGSVVLAIVLIRSWRDRAIALVALALVFGILLAIPGVGSRASSIIDFRSDPSAMDRVYLGEVSWKMFVEHPITGVGIQAFRAAYPYYADPRVTIDPVTDGHQMPLSVPAEVGILGLLAEVILACALIRLLARSLRAEHHPVFPAGLASMSAIAVMGFFNTFIFFESLWIAAALVGADWVIAQHRGAVKVA